MRSQFQLSFLGLIALVILSGCTATRALQHETVLQSNTLSEIQQQQVLNNLAKFVQNPNALPDFAWPKEGSANVNDHCEGSGSIMWDAAGFVGAALSSALSRDKQHAWTLEPINDPRKLELMRCAYQRAVANCGNDGPSTSCPDCHASTKAFYGTDPGSAGMSEIASYDCISPGCCTWFACGPENKIPKCCHHVGRYCGTCVWILPGGEDEFTKLTLTILDFAINDPAQARQKVVELHYDINQDGSRGKINSWQETFSADVDDPLKPSTAITPTMAAPRELPENANRLETNPPMYVPQNPTYPQQRTQVPPPGILQFRQQLNTLAPNR